jgi:hypothetical protein
MFVPFLPPNCEKPPTLYTILESIVNPDVDLNEPAPDVKIKDLPREGRAKIFNFDYPLSTHINKENFEILILKHYLMRRINFDTVTAFRINLDAKLNEIMPMYNKMFDALDNWNIFSDGEITTRTGQDNTTTSNTNTRQNQSTNNSSNSLTNNSTTGDTSTSDRRGSETPQDHLEEIRNGEYVTQYNYDTTTSSGTDSSTSNGSSQSTTNESGTENNNGTDNKTYTETITRTPGDKISIMKEMQENIKSIYSLIYKELDCLFYSLV